MNATKKRWAPLVVGGALGAGCATVVRRMEHEYADVGSLRPATVTAMYATYTGYAAAFAWALRRRTWPVPLPEPAAQAIGLTAAAVGGAAAIAGMSRFDSTAQISATDTGHLHTGGLYRWSRNPQYLGNGLLVSGAAVAGRSGFAGVLATGVWLIYRRWIPSEERHLSREFGDEYAAYRSRVRRWLGRRSNDQQRP